ncbi:MAG: flagellar basal body L-ring protein FlgH, partial [Bdellovibrionales bacterium]|nr:flagellar basal body L-ring protein FlgH [Bdellovibrionales bacterium]
PSAQRASEASDEWDQPGSDKRADQNPYERMDQAARDESRQERGPTQQQTARIKRVTKNDFVDQSGDSGSLWAAEGESNFFFSKNRARSPGDIITVTLESEMLRDITLEVKRSLSIAERRKELDILEAKQEAQLTKGTDGAKATETKDQVATSAAAPEAADLSYSSVDLSGVIGMKAGDSILAEIVERYSNGNYKIRGSKRVPYRNTTKLMSFVGIVRGNDLTSEEKIPSGKIYEYRLQVLR